MAFDTTQMSSHLNYSKPQPGDPCHPLAAGAHPPAVAFVEGAHGCTVNEVAEPLSFGGGKPGQGYPAVAFTERTRADGRNFEAQEDLAYALTNPGSGGRTHSRQLLDPRMSVRRLTPQECERLQGFPDDFTAITWRGKPAADGPRYRALGNAMAVPVIGWILRRILAETLGNSLKLSDTHGNSLKLSDAAVTETLAWAAND